MYLGAWIRVDSTPLVVMGLPKGRVIGGKAEQEHTWVGRTSPNISCSNSFPGRLAPDAVQVKNSSLPRQEPLV